MDSDDMRRANESAAAFYQQLALLAEQLRSANE
jgi:hypothetical protein